MLHKDDVHILKNIDCIKIFWCVNKRARYVKMSFFNSVRYFFTRIVNHPYCSPRCAITFYTFTFLVKKYLTELKKDVFTMWLVYLHIKILWCNQYPQNVHIISWDHLVFWFVQKYALVVEQWPKNLPAKAD
jgi:hypothetical protein